MLSKTQRKPRQRNLPQLAGRLFGTPLLADERKLDAIVPVFLRRLNGEQDVEPNPEDQRDVDEPIVDQATGIAVIPVIGSLIRRPSMMQAFSGLTSYGDIAESLDCALGDARVRAILLQIDSFGGEAGGCFELCDKIYNARSIKPIWAIADIESLSAGYAIGCSASQLWVDRQGHVGSIGVVSIHVERSKQNEMMGVTYTIMRAGDRKGDFNPYEKLSAEAAATQMEYIERTRQTFAETVARNRPALSIRSVMDTEGQVFDAKDGLNLQLVDGIDSYEGVFARLTAAFPAPTSARPVPPPEPLAPAVDPEAEEDDEGGGENALSPETSEGLMDPRTPTTNSPQAPAPATAAPAAPAPAPAAAAAQAPATPTVAPTTPAAAAGPDNVVALDTQRPGMAASEIVELCQIAGREDLCSSYIRQGLSVGEVRKNLIDLRASASGGTTAPALNNHPPSPVALTSPQMVAGPQAASMSAWDDAFARVHTGDPRFASK